MGARRCAPSRLCGERVAIVKSRRDATSIACSRRQFGGGASGSRFSDIPITSARPAIDRTPCPERSAKRTRDSGSSLVNSSTIPPVCSIAASTHGFASGSVMEIPTSNLASGSSWTRLGSDPESFVTACESLPTSHRGSSEAPGRPPDSPPHANTESTTSTRMPRRPNTTLTSIACSRRQFGGGASGSRFSEIDATSARPAIDRMPSPDSSAKSTCDPGSSLVKCRTMPPVSSIAASTHGFASDSFRPIPTSNVAPGCFVSCAGSEP